MTAGIQLYPGGQLPPEVAAGWAGAGLAELTHAPTGFSGLGTGVVTLAPGEAGPVQRYPAGDALLVVLEGTLVVESAAGLAVVAVTGDIVGIAARTAHRARHAGGPQVRYVRIAPSGDAVPV